MATQTQQDFTAEDAENRREAQRISNLLRASLRFSASSAVNTLFRIDADS